MNQIFGNLNGLRAGERGALERLSKRKNLPKEIVSANVLRSAGEISAQTGRQIALLVSRDGAIEHVCVGTKDRVYLPDLGRFRLGESRLRRLRVIVLVPRADKQLRYFPRTMLLSSSREYPGPELVNEKSRILAPRIASDLLTDLEKLRLDCVLCVAVNDDGQSQAASLVHLEPPSQERLRQSFGTMSSQCSFSVTNMRSVSDLTLDFTEFVRDLEKRFGALLLDSHGSNTERAILVGAYTTSQLEANASMEELIELARTAGLTVLDTIIQRRRSLDPKTLIGKGKLEDLVLHCLDLEAEMVIFDRELSPGQLRAITNVAELKVLDRSMLILDIFAQRAKSSEGRLQVELAQLKYSLPRLTDRDSGLSRLTGGIGGRGPGETKLEVGRRRARQRIVDLEKRIETISQQRSLRRSRRQNRGVPVIAIVGYTNAGKSTLLNSLTKGDVFVENKMFATLDPSSRRMRFPNEKEVIFVDTVGFIRELPSELITAFRATLEEVGEANLLLHVVDASHAELLEQVSVVRRTLAELGYEKKPSILVLNKADRISALEARTLSRSLGALIVSSTERSGFDLLLQSIQGVLADTFGGQDPGGFLFSEQIMPSDEQEENTVTVSD